MFKIEDISNEDFTARRKRKSIKYPFDEMAVGQSFFVDSKTATNASVRVAAHRASIDGKTFTTSKTSEGCRVFRVG